MPVGVFVFVIVMLSSAILTWLALTSMPDMSWLVIEARRLLTF
jgi:hypothetical protein